MPKPINIKSGKHSSNNGQARRIVLELLTRMDETGSFSNIILDNAFTENNLSDRDKAFSAMLFYGVLERKLTLDYQIRQYSNIEYDEIALKVRQILRMGFYQLMYMDSVTENAGVNESVNLAPHEAKGFVNGVLRAFLRGGAKLDTCELAGEAKLSVEFSCPKWLVKMWVRQYGRETAVELLKASFGRPPIYIRVNTYKYNISEVITSLNKEKIEAEKIRCLDNCLEVGRVKGIELTDTFRKGMFHVQDMSSQLCCKLIAPGFNEVIFDMCSAPGGKAFTIAQNMNNRGKIKAFDMYSGRLSLIDSGAKRLGLSIIETAENNAAVYNANLGQADRVLCDVPCSGLGVIRRKPEIKYKSKESIESLPELQKQILETSSRYVKDGGTLVYSTCTLNRAENEEVTDFFQSNHPEFVPVNAPTGLSSVEDSSSYTFFPHITGGDGFYTAMFRKLR